MPELYSDHFISLKVEGYMHIEHFHGNLSGCVLDLYFAPPNPELGI
jgi:hypothetical protein